jgi:GGDEF domain-containing protein
VICSRLIAVTEHDCAEAEAKLAAATAELERIKFTLDVVGTVDLDTGLLNRNGIFESIQRAQRWLVRRGDIYGVLYVMFPDLDVSNTSDPSYLEMMKHLAATIGAGVRDVDEVGRAADNAFAAVLANLEPGALHIVAERVEKMLLQVTQAPNLTGDFLMGGVEILTASHTYGTVLDTAQRLCTQATAGHPSLSTI